MEFWNGKCVGTSKIILLFLSIVNYLNICHCSKVILFFWQWFEGWIPEHGYCGSAAEERRPKIETRENGWSSAQWKCYNWYGQS